MTAAFKVALIQNCAGAEIAANVAETAAMTREAARGGAALVALSEYFSALDSKDGRLAMRGYAEAAHPALPAFRELARECDIWVHLGSLPIDSGGGKIFNRGYLLDPSGAIVARYDKIFLFDVDLANGESYRESATIAPGNKAVVAETPWGGYGLTVCYDLRFPQLYRALAQGGASYLSVPAAFTKTTGEAHWHLLNRARAIENGAFVIAPCQCGEHPGGAKTYGHSLVIDPWGRVLADGGVEPGIVTAEIDPAEVAKVRAMIPSLSHDRPFTLAPARAVEAAE